MVEPANLQIGKDDRARFALGIVNAGSELEYARTTVFFRWAGSDEGDDISGAASAERRDDGAIEIELSFDNGDDAILAAKRDGPPQQPARSSAYVRHPE